MDGHGSQGTRLTLPPAARRSTKGKAPPPPTAEGLDSRSLSLRLQLSAMDQKENLVDQDLTLTVVLPGGVEKMAVVHGSKPMMDLLVMLCAKYHLNPSSHTIELISTNRNHIKFKPNALIGALEAERIVLKPKGVDEKNKKTEPQMPEATVRLTINYKQTQKTILRVNPRVPLEELMPAVCEKCEFDQKTSILLRDVRSEEPLDLTKCLNDFGLREVYARDTQSIGSEFPSSPVHDDKGLPSKGKTLKEKENKGLFSMFRKSTKKSEQPVIVSAPTSPVSNKPRPVSLPPLGANTSAYSSNTMPSDMPKKRRAPLPPVMVSQGFPSNPGGPHSAAAAEVEQEVSGISRGSSTESSLKRTKRKAPLPPSSPPAVATQDEALEDGNTKGGAAHSPLEEIHEQEEMVVSATPDSGTVTNVQEDDPSFGASTDVSMDSGKTEATPTPSDVEMPSLSPPPSLEGTGEDHSNDLSSDGKPAKDPVSDQECTEQTLNTAENAELEHRVSAGSDSSVPAVGQTGLSEENASALYQDKEKSDTGPCLAPSTLETSALPSPSPLPLAQDAQILTSDQQSSEGSEEQMVKAQVLVNDCAASTAGYVPAQSDVQPPASQEVASFSESARLKRDMATSTEELHPNGSPSALPQPSKSPPIYVLDSTPKPKPSNELTREYIPKVGLTTYTIVPQKSLEKLRYFEVELTLEAPEVAIGASVPDHTAVSANQPGLHSLSSGGYSPLRNGMVTSDDTHQGNVPPTRQAAIPSQRDVDVQADLGPAAKEKKIPPATKPKPGSFRLSPHKRNPGGYVTSAAVKTANAGHVSGHKEAQGSPDAGQITQAVEENSFPPPPPPVQWTEEATAEGSQEELKPRFERGCSLDVPAFRPNRPNPSVVAPIPGVKVPTPRLTRQWSLPAKDPPLGLSLEKLRSFAAPKPYMSTSHSRFAQAVSSAIKRSQSFTQASSADPKPQRILPGAALVSQYSIKELAEPSRSPEKEAVGKALALRQPDCGAGGGMPLKMPGISDQGEIQDICGDAMPHLEGQTHSPTVPDAFPPVSLNGGPTETQPTEVE